MHRCIADGAGHDNGLIVFKLERERPAFSLSGNQLFYVKDKIIRMADLGTGTNQGICNVRKLGSQWVQPRTLSYNPAERAVLVTSVSASRKVPVNCADGMVDHGQWAIRARDTAENHRTFSRRWQRDAIGREEGDGHVCDLRGEEQVGCAGQARSSG